MIMMCNIKYRYVGSMVSSTDINLGIARKINLHCIFRKQATNVMLSSSFFYRLNVMQQCLTYQGC